MIDIISSKKHLCLHRVSTMNLTNVITITVTNIMRSISSISIYVVINKPFSPQSQYHESYKWAMKAVQLLVPSNPPKVGTYHHDHDVNHHDFDDNVAHDHRHDHRFTTGDHRCVTSGQQGLCCQKRVRQSKLLMIMILSIKIFSMKLIIG